MNACFVFLAQRGRQHQRGRADGKKFSQLGTRNVMAGVLLTRGPLTTLRSACRLSGVFNDGLSKAKFLSAAKKLEEAGFGSLVEHSHVGRPTQVFIKKAPSEVEPLFQESSGFSDLCHIEEYAQKYCLQPSPVVGHRIKTIVVQMGLVKAECFHDL